MVKHTTTRVTHSADETRAVGAALGRALLAVSLDRPLAVALDGELGAGKTTFVRGVLEAFGTTHAIRSPTYTLVEPYEFAGRSVFHLDLYRLADPRELEALAIRDLLAPESILIVEWAERGEGGLPAPELKLSFTYLKDNDRQIQTQAMTMRGKELARSLEG